MTRIGLLVEGETDEVLLPGLLRGVLGSLRGVSSKRVETLTFPFPPNGYGEIPKNLRMLVRLWAIPSERERLGCDAFIVIHDSRKTEAVQKEIRGILKNAPGFPAVYGLAILETEAWVLGDIENANRHVFKVDPMPPLPGPPERDPVPKKTLSDLFVRPSSEIEFDRWNCECARRVAPHLRHTQVAFHCKEGFGKLASRIKSARRLFA